MVTAGACISFIVIIPSLFYLSWFRSNSLNTFLVNEVFANVLAVNNNKTAIKDTLVG